MKKKILFVDDEQMFGGVSKVLNNVLNVIDYNQYEVDLLILHNRGNAFDSVPEQVTKIYGTKFFRTIDLEAREVFRSCNPLQIMNKLRMFYLLKTGKIEKKIQKERKKILKDKIYDVEIGFKDGFCDLFTAFGNAKKKIIWLHTDYRIFDCTAKYTALFKKAHEHIDLAVAITEDVKNSFQEIYQMEDRTKVIANLIEEETIQKKAQEQVTKFDTKYTNFITVGRLAREKGYDRLLRSLGKLKREGLLEDVRMYIVGAGREEQVLKKIMQEEQLEQEVIFLGYQENPYAYMKQADLFVLTSLFEGLGMVLYESLVLGVPCFATEVANIDQTLNKGAYGKIVENTEEAIYEGLKEVILEKEKIEQWKKEVSDFHYPEQEIIEEINKMLGE